RLVEPESCKLKQHDGRQKADEVRDATLPVAPEEVVQRHVAGPPVIPESLVHDADDPARFLPYRRGDGVGKILANADDVGFAEALTECRGEGVRHLAVFDHREAHEYLAHPLRSQPESDVVVLRETLDVERHAVTVCE